MFAFVATKPEAEERFKICQECDKMSIMKTCKLCGCFMPAKVKFRQVSCPDGKWQAIPFRDTQTWLSEDPNWDDDMRY